VIQTVREKFACEHITQPPAPFHATPRGWAGPSLLAMMLFEKFGQHQPLNRQPERYAREGVELNLSTLADQVPLLARGRTATARLWVYVRDDRPFAGGAPPAALFRFSRDRRGEHPRAHLAQWSGILQADAYGGFGDLYAADRLPAPITEALCWAHARRKFFELADIAANARRGNSSAGCAPSVSASPATPPSPRR
jgi:hypothetical protein